MLIITSELTLTTKPLPLPDIGTGQVGSQTADTIDEKPRFRSWMLFSLSCLLANQ